MRAARAEIARLEETVKEQAIELVALRGGEEYLITRTGEAVMLGVAVA